MTRILGIDVQTSSFFADSMSFATCVVDTINQNYELNESLSTDDLLEQIKYGNLDILAIDHINELKLDLRIMEFLVDLPHLVVREISEYNGSSKSLIAQARKYGISLKSKPDPMKTAIICCLLASKTGRDVKFVRTNGKIQTVFGQSFHTPQNYKDILNQKITHAPKETTHRQSFADLGNSTYISEITNIVGYGKESIVYRVKDIHGRDAIAKTFRTYSSISKKIYNKTYKASIGHIPMVMARNEVKFLKLLYSYKFPVPEVYFRDDNTVLMESIINDKKEISAPLSSYQKAEFLRNEIEELMFQGIDHLFHMFKEVNLVHGDYSANNLLVKDDQLIIIDVSQAMLINTNTFVETPLRLRIDQALDTVFRDLDGYLTFFEKRFRLNCDREFIFNEYLTLVPASFYDKIEIVTEGWRGEFY